MTSIDVVIPNYNYGRYLRQSIESVLSQDVEHLRLLIIDNASTDDSAEIARAFARTDQRVEVRIRDRNLGLHASFNEGIDWAASEYFLILCSDDALMPGALRRAATFMSQHPNVHLTYGACLTGSSPATSECAGKEDRKGDWRICSGSAFLEMFCGVVTNPVHGPTVVVRTEVQKRVGYYRPALPHTCDMEIWLRFSRHGDVAHTNEVQAFAREHGGNLRASIPRVLGWSNEFEAAFVSFFDHEGRNMPDAARLLDQVQRCLTDRAYWAAMSFLLRGDSGGIDLMKYAICRRPLALVSPPFGYALRSKTFRRRLPPWWPEWLLPVVERQTEYPRYQ